MAPIGMAISRGATASDIVDCVKLAESLGYESAWVAEGHGGDQFSILSACAATTSTIKLGTAISSVFVRSAPTIAMAAATVDDLSNGRFILGLGSSHKVQVVPEHGVTYEKPIQRLRETVEVVRALLAEGVVSYQGETITIENFDFWFEPRRAKIPIYVAGLFPKMTEICGEIADGIILTRSTLKTATEIRRNLAVGAARVGRDPADIKLTSLLPTAVAEAFGKGDMEGANRAVTDAMIDATSVAGTPEQCRERIAAYRDSGIELPIISLFMRGGDAKARFEAAIRACAGA